MPGLIWSPAALKDVQRLYRFLAPKNLDTVIVLAVRHQKEAGF
jgi:plasmid stabilization system protein ParE